MKTKKLPKRKSHSFSSYDDIRKSGVKQDKQKRAKKMSIYDEMSDDEFGENFASDEDFNDYDYDKEDRDDYY